MPHLVLNGTVDVQRLAAELQPAVVRWGRAVLKTGGVWLHAKDETALVEGVVVEHARPLHPVALVARRDRETVVRLWPVVEVERTPAVQRWLATVACEVQRLGCGPVTTSNIGSDILDGLELELDVD